ncbi:6-phospho-beta-glucosidase [Rugosimonospora africana]|uniref:6-phospho-beta-glucosidase n=1 Tax=Rugosimonospora africana TaxID=556532 RepID=A0A8J3VVV9_9ACTN|nr:6-phospho-beta-glucosidase [Rugosimonospora africana]GIH20171.1 6-phospho-beta-glucosidase [Rugosimonospora africana]
MRLTILGGGGFRVPLIYRALLADRAEGRVTDVTLYDLDATRLAAIGRVLAEQARDVPDAPRVTATTDLVEALTGADFVFVAIRVAGLEGRAIDERIAAAEGVLGQETVGAGGISYGLRTVPVATAIARRIAESAPDAWVINFTNPAGLVTEAMSRHLGDRVVGICDTPAALGRRVATALGADPHRLRLDYAGLNHLGWLRAVYLDGRDLLPALLADDGALESFDEGRLFGAEWLRALGAIPNEYLHYYYSNRELVAAARDAAATRAEFLIDQQRRCYALLATTAEPLSTWSVIRAERDGTYMAENRAAAGLAPTGRDHPTSGGYEDVALALMRAIARDEPATLILNVRNRGTLGFLDDDAVVEVPCTVDARGVRPELVGPLPDHAAALVCSVKASERAVLDAAEHGSRASALRALATHPLVDSVAVAGRLLEVYRQRFPELAYLKATVPRRSPPPGVTGASPTRPVAQSPSRPMIGPATFSS